MGPSDEEEEGGRLASLRRLLKFIYTFSTNFSFKKNIPLCGACKRIYFRTVYENIVPPVFF